MSKLVLVIEDNPSISMILGAMLKRQGYEVDLQSGWQGAETFALIQKIQPDLIFTDFMLGSNVDGLEVVEQLQYDFRTAHIPIIVCTADARAIATLQQNPRTQHVAVLVKPFTYQGLVETVTKVFDQQIINHSE